MRLRPIVALTCLVLAMVCVAFGQSRDIAIKIDSPAGTEAGELINGYASTVSGQTMQYHSAHPDAEMALIARARRDVQSIVWETDPLPATVPGGVYHLVWLAGLEHAGWTDEKTPHTWEMFINGDHWFTFKNAKDDSAKNWTVTAKDGARLSFRSSKADVFGDLFGYMFLDAPQKDFPAGKALRIEVRGEDADSLDWYMTFQHRFESEPRLRTEPVLLKTPGAPTQVLRVSLDNLAAGRSIEIQTAGQPAIHAALDVGGNVFQVPVAAVTTDTPVGVTFQLGSQAAQHYSVTLKPVRHRDIYLLPYSHNDIGYTDLQPNVERKQWNNLEQALELIHRTRDYPPDARYKWNMEVIWALDTYLRQAAPQRREEVLAAIRNGDLGVNALYANMLTGLANSVEMEHFLDYARALRRQSLPVTTALTSDVPGFTWGIVTALAHAGVKYFAMAPNNGDRIGHTLEAWGDKPFYWVSQSGQEKVLAWVAGASYSSFHEGTLAKLGDEKILKMVRHLDEIHYPYDIFQLPYTTGDNGAPDPTLPDTVKAWNERYASPHLIIATHARMFEDFEKRYGSQLPMVRGDFTPYWEDGAASTASETALARRAADRLIDDGVLWSMLSQQQYPAAEFAEAWRNAVLWDEHTWGADKSITDPDLPFVTSQWEFKKHLADESDSLSRDLEHRVLAPSTGAGSAVDVHNTTSWRRSDLVILPRELSSAGDRAVDVSGKLLRSQRLSTGELAVLVADVPAFAAMRVRIEPGPANDRGSAVADGNHLSNGRLSLAIDPQTGAIRDLHEPGEGNLVDPSNGMGLNQYEYVLGRDPAAARTLSNVSVEVRERGGLVSSLVITGTAPGATTFSSELRVVDGLDRVDIVDSLDKQKVREKEALHFAFPFEVKDGVVRYDVADSIVPAVTGQLPGSCKNYVSAQSWVDVSNDRDGVTLAMPDTLLVEIGGMNAEQGWMTEMPVSQRIFSYVMNNYWHTNYKADQEGRVTFRYSLAPHAAFVPGEAVRFGWEQRHPLLAVAATSSESAGQPLVAVDSSSVDILSVTPLANDAGWLLYVYNASNAPQTAHLRWNTAAPVSLRLSDAFAAAGKPLSGGLELGPFATSYVRVERRLPRSR